MEDDEVETENTLEAVACSSDRHQDVARAANPEAVRPMCKEARV